MKNKSILVSGALFVFAAVACLLTLQSHRPRLAASNPPQHTGVGAISPSFHRKFRPGVDGIGYPTCAYCPTPKYSADARKLKYEGFVILKAVITPDGHASEIEVVKADPGLGLEKMAIDAVKLWRFHPALDPSGTPVPVELAIEVTFSLSGSTHKWFGTG
jgi:TonB family protein